MPWRGSDRRLLAIDRDGTLDGLVVVADGWLAHLQSEQVLPLPDVYLASMRRVELRVPSDMSSDLPAESWRLSLLLNDNARLADGAAFGEIEDVIFDGEGRIAGVVVEQTVQAGVGGLHFWTYEAERYRPGDGLVAAGSAAFPAPAGLAASDQH